jgi:DNA polymerase
MLLKSEQSLGLKSVPWKLARSARTAAPSQRVAPKAPPRAVAPAPQPPIPVRATPAPARPAHPVSAMKAELVQALGGEELSVDRRIEELNKLNDQSVKPCRKCVLCEQRTNTVFGEGSPTAKLFFIGEGPGETEDQTGRPFVGRAGQLLTKMIEAMGLSREQVYIANVVKCRPPGNRTPAPDEVQTCTPYLVRQLEIIRPSVIVTLGLPATQYMLQTTASMGSMRGKWQSWRGIKLMPTYHPSYVLRSYTPAVRGAVWSDLQMVMQELGLKGKKTPTGSGV